MIFLRFSRLLLYLTTLIALIEAVPFPNPAGGTSLSKPKSGSSPKADVPKVEASKPKPVSAPQANPVKAADPKKPETTDPKKAETTDPKESEATKPNKEQGPDIEDPSEEAKKNFKQKETPAVQQEQNLDGSNRWHTHIAVPGGMSDEELQYHAKNGFNAMEKDFNDRNAPADGTPMSKSKKAKMPNAMTAHYIPPSEKDSQGHLFLSSSTKGLKDGKTTAGNQDLVADSCEFPPHGNNGNCGEMSTMSDAKKKNLNLEGSTITTVRKGSGDGKVQNFPPCTGADREGDKSGCRNYTDKHKVRVVGDAKSPEPNKPEAGKV